MMLELCQMPSRGLQDFGGTDCCERVTLMSSDLGADDDSRTTQLQYPLCMHRVITTHILRVQTGKYVVICFTVYL